MSKVFLESSFLLNTYIYHCLDNDINIDMDKTFCRRCVLMVLHGKYIKRRIKAKFSSDPKNKDKLTLQENREKVLEYVFKNKYKLN